MDLDLEDNTLVIFTSDNGGIRKVSCQDPLRAGKGSYYEGGIRVPLVIEFNKKRFRVKPGKPTVKKLNLSKAGGFTPFVVRDTKGKVLGGTRLFSHATNRKMVLIFPPKKGKKRMDIRYFSD